MKEKHKKYLVEIKVYEEIFREARRGLSDDLDMKEAVEDEFGWLCQSGIHLVKLNEIKKSRKVT